MYGAAIRQAGGNVTMAEDITQSVFNAMARKAGSLSRHPVLSGWLYNYVRHLTANQRRADRRRQQREQASFTTNSEDASSEPETLWEELKPILDDAMHGLKEKDRTAVTQRFHQKLSLREVGTSLGLSENAARMRVGRALEKLRDLLAQRGVTSTAASLTAALGVGSVVCAPSGMAATVAVEALTANACLGATTTATTVTTIMNLTKMKVTLAAALATAGLGLTVWQDQQLENLAQENSSLQTELSELPQLRAEVERLRALKAEPSPPTALPDENQEAKLEIARLRGSLNMANAQLTQLARQNAAPPAVEDPATPSKDMNKIMQASMKMAAQSQTLAKLPRLTERLSLSMEQEEATRDILQRQYDQTLELAEKMLAGEVKPGEIPPTKEPIVNPMAEIRALLTPEQLEQYRQIQQQQLKMMSELMPQK